MENYTELNLNKEEELLVNNVLLQQCLDAVTMANAQVNEENIERFSQMVQSSIACQQSFFKASNGLTEGFPEAMVKFVRVLLEKTIENLENMKDQMVAASDESWPELMQVKDSFVTVLQKFPEEKLIVTP